MHSANDPWLYWLGGFIWTILKDKWKHEGSKTQTEGTAVPRPTVRSRLCLRQGGLTGSGGGWAQGRGTRLDGILYKPGHKAWVLLWSSLVSPWYVVNPSGSQSSFLI